MTKLAALLSGLVSILIPGLASAQDTAGATSLQIQQRLNELKAMKQELQDKIQAQQDQMHDFDARVRTLEAAEKDLAAREAAAQKAVVAPPVQKAAVEPQKPVVVAMANAPVTAGPAKPAKKQRSKTGYEPGTGFVISRGSLGEMDVSLVTYMRYLNQLNLDHSYADSFGREKTLKLRQDAQLNKVTLTFKGWLFDPDIKYKVYVWTQQPAQGEGAQVVVGGYLTYHVNDYLNVNGGIFALPTTRSTNDTFPLWLKNDNRTIADEFFRGSFTQGFWADGKILEDVDYRVMIGNNLSNLGVSAAQLDSGFNTMSGAVWWMPTTGEFGPQLGFGDYEHHDKPATMFGLHFTRSREDKQSQSDPDSFENSQIRLSDGTQIFSLNAFNTPGQINKATYQMLDFNAGLKYQGFALESEFYWRWVDDFRTSGVIPVTSLFDRGYQIQGSAMVIPKELQAYVSGSQVLGQYGDPWDLTMGLNWYPFDRKQIHINAEGIYLRHSPVGGLTLPYTVGGNGWVFNTDFILTF